ncbi:MAG TPA: hypothetical protein VKK61_04175, partial [Tepidisphaeraceae bacterium]|nr:hypothetical protein [Tepidisphaeraceae bacterium]
FEPGPLCVFAMLCGAALGLRSESREKSQPKIISIAALSAVMIFLIAAALGIIAPISIAESTAQRGDDYFRDAKTAQAAKTLHDAFDLLWIPNADYAYRAAVVMEQANLPAEQIRALLDAAVHADPMSIRYLQARAEFELHQPQPDAVAIIRDFEKIIELNPNEVSLHKEFADALIILGEKQRAIEQLQVAIHYNDLLSPDEPKRLATLQIQAIQQQIDQLNHK